MADIADITLERRAEMARELVENPIVMAILDDEENGSAQVWKDSLDPFVRENAWNYVRAIIRLRNRLKAMKDSALVEQLQEKQTNLDLT